MGNVKDNRPDMLGSAMARYADLSGNVYEWDHNWYGEFFIGTLEHGIANPQGLMTGTEHFLRADSWITP